MIQQAAKEIMDPAFWKTILTAMGMAAAVTFVLVDRIEDLATHWVYPPQQRD